MTSTLFCVTHHIVCNPYLLSLSAYTWPAPAHYDYHGNSTIMTISAMTALMTISARTALISPVRMAMVAEICMGQFQMTRLWHRQCYWRRSSRPWLSMLRSLLVAPLFFRQRHLYNSLVRCQLLEHVYSGSTNGRWYCTITYNILLSSMYLSLW
jgi:hypothetical protein